MKDMAQLRKQSVEAMKRKMTREQMERYILKRIHRQKPAQELPPLFELERTRADGDEGLVRYGFLGKDMTDEEIEEELDYMRIRINSPYDCTGKLFTAWIHWHRNPTGIVTYAHHMRLDV